MSGSGRICAQLAAPPWYSLSLPSSLLVESFAGRESFVRREETPLENWPCSLEEILDSREGTEDPFMPAHAGRSLYSPVGQVQASRDYVLL